MSKGIMSKGIITTYVLVFGAIFLLLISGLLGFILFQLRESRQRIAWNEALQIAEAGINYYHWCLNNGVQDSCSLEKEYTDSTGKPIGKFSLNIVSSTGYGEIIQAKVISRGWTYDFPRISRKISAIYAKESVGKYAYLLNDSAQVEAGQKIRGLYHSNRGIRMDGENRSLVTSVQDTWLCTRSSFHCYYWDCPQGCSQEGEACRCPGVFTTTGNSNLDLFDFSVLPFDFTGITVDLARIKDLTDEYPQQYYWPPVTELDPEGDGYHVILKNDGTFEVRIITKLDPVEASSLEEGWQHEYSIINDEYVYGTSSIAIDPARPLIFVEDNLWLEGEVKGKVSIASANLRDSNQDTDVWLRGNIDYTTLDGSDGLAVIGERNVLITPDSPNKMKLRGIFIAQKGHFGRNRYSGNIRESLEINGSVVSNGQVRTKWPSGGIIASGYRKRENYIDFNLIYDPPPLVPEITSDFKLISWEEIE